MLTKTRRVAVAVVLTLLAAYRPNALAQYTFSGQQNLISGTSSNWIGDYVIGSNTFANVLRIQNGGVLSNWYGYLGFVNYSYNNSVSVSGPGSIWSNQDDLYVGRNGYGNRMVVSNGGWVVNNGGFIGGGYVTSSSDNSVLVTDPGSVWFNRSLLEVGYLGPRNSLVISNGGVVVSYGCFVGPVSNSVLVTDAGSVWSNRSSVTIGEYGPGNSLVISNGGQVVSVSGGVGNYSSNNTVLVTGAGSAWINSDTVYVGYFGGSNALTVAGGTVRAADMIVTDLLRVNGGTVVVTNGLGSGSLQVGGTGPGNVIVNDGTVTVDSLILTNGAGSAMTFGSGWLRGGHSAVSNASAFAVGDGTNDAVFSLAGGIHSFADGLWIRTNALLVGCGIVNGSVLVDGEVNADCGGMLVFTGTVTNYGRVEVKNGTSLVLHGSLVNYGQIVATNGVVSYSATFENNGTAIGDIQYGQNVWVATNDGKWEVATNWSQGMPSAGYRSLITNSVSKTVTIDAISAGTHPESLTVIDLTLSAPNGSTNVLQVNNPGSVAKLQVSGELSVGGGGKLVVSNAAIEVSRLAEGNLSIDGEVALTAANLIVTNASILVGSSGPGQMTAHGTTVLTHDVSLGQSPAASGVLTVSGSGSVWSNQSDFYIGDGGHDDNLVIAGGAQIINGHDGFVGHDSASSNNVVLVTDANSVWSNGSGLFIGFTGTGNSLVISNGGQVVVDQGSYSISSAVGTALGSSNNTVLVTGSGSVWSCSGNLYAGGGGSWNNLAITGGGRVENGSGCVGGNSTASNNTVLVSDVGSVWSNGSLTVGQYSGLNSLVISNGAQVISLSGTVGLNSGDRNSALVIGTGSVWAISSDLFVGNSGDRNSLVISDGGKVVDNNGNLGTALGTNNSVVVSGVGSVWSNRATIIIGYNGAGNSLVVSNGGQVVSEDILIGLFRSRNSLVISNGGKVFDTSASIGITYPTSNNNVLVSGPGSVWSHRTTLILGAQGPGNSLVITNGGQVIDDRAVVGSSSNSNVVRVVDGGIWQNNILIIGGAPLSNLVLIAGGTVYATNVSSGVFGCGNPPGSNSFLQLDSGSLIVTNATHDATLDVRNGTLILNGGMLQVDKLVMTNRCGVLVRKGGTVLVDTLVLDPSLSALGDGIPNGWKQQYGFDPLDPTVANADTDGDGMSNLQEFLAGANPLNSSSGLRITAITPVGVDVRVYFTSVGGKYYSLQRCNSMGGVWVDIVTNIPGDDGIQWVKDIGGATRTNAYYRIRLPQLSFPPPSDSDGDGVADAWAQQYFGHPAGQAADRSHAINDPDGDGMSNLQEFLAGTDPTNPASAFHIISLANANNDVLIKWMMGSGKTNALQATTGGGFDTNGFADLFAVTNTIGTVTNYLDVGAATNRPARYYRVRLVP